MIPRGHPRSITYLLGAGASGHALPLSQETEGFIRAFAAYLQNLNISDVVVRNARLDLYTDLFRLADEYPRYGSYDKMAKHLLSEGPDFPAMREAHAREEAHFREESPFPFYLNIDKTTTLARLKTLLATFYFYEQFRDKRKDDYRTCVQPGKETTVTTPLRELEAVDPRIEQLIRSCLQTGEGVIPSNVKFLTWNYDLQLELAYASVKGMADVYKAMASDALNVHPGRQHGLEHNTPTVIHLNGVAGLIWNLETAQMRLMDYGEAPHTLSIQQLLEQNGAATNRMHLGDFPWSHHETFSFAWEDHWPSRFAQSYFSRIGVNTNILVLFGYSRPQLNERTDFRFLESFLLTQPHYDKKIILCGAQANAEDLRETWSIPSTVKIIVDHDITRIPTPQEIRERYGPNPTYPVHSPHTA